MPPHCQWHHMMDNTVARSFPGIGGGVGVGQKRKINIYLYTAEKKEDKNIYVKGFRCQNDSLR